MTKPVLFYALVSGSLYSPGFRVLAVTGEAHGQTYGRDENDHTTHVGRFDVLWKFPEGTTEEFAKAARDRANAVDVRLNPEINRLEGEVMRLRKARDNARLAAAKGQTTDD